MSQTDQTEEITGSRQKLEEILGGSVDTFSYPYGNWAENTVKMVETAGFRIALTTDGKAVDVGADPLRLGRFGVGDWKGDKFKNRLEEFFRC